MAGMDMHEVTFEWPYAEPKTVIVTGSFDKWSSTRKLTKTATGFVGTTKIPWNQKILYKYIVDGHWALVYGRPVEIESGTGFVNHVYIAPPKPPVVLPESKAEPIIADTTAHAPANADKIADIPTSSSPVFESGVVATAAPVAEEPANEPAESSATPIAAGLGAHAKPEPEVGEASIADAKSDSGTTAVADPEPTTDIMNAPLDPISSPKASPSKEHTAEKVNNKPPPLPTTPTKGEVFPSVSPPSSPSRFSSLRGSGKKKRTPSFFAKLKEVFKSDKEKDHSGREKAETKN